MELDLRDLAYKLNGAEYNPESFPGLIFRITKPKSGILIFHSGKIVCTGTKTLDQVAEAIAIMVQNLREAGVKIEKDPAFKVQNIVASADLGQELNLNAIAVSLGLDRVEYEPEQFPGLVYRINSPKVVVLLFGTGKMVCTGAKVEKDAELAVQILKEELRSLNLL